ncbi:MAG: hypothetical protein ACTSVI_08125 [Promethearchaeota archaeon]
MSFEERDIEDDLDEDMKYLEDEYSTEDIVQEATSRLLIEHGEPLPVKRIIVNLWRTSAHGAKIGIKKGAQWQSKSRQFNPEMNIVGDVLYEFDEEKLISERALKYWEVKYAQEIGINLKDTKGDPQKYKKLILDPFKKVNVSEKKKLLEENNEKVPPIPPENDRKLVITLNSRYWDTKLPDKSRLQEIDVDKDGKVDKKEFLENYLVRKFREFADLNRRLIIKLFRDLAHSRKEMQGVWMGTIEQSLVESLTLTFGEKDPLFSGVITLPGFDYEINIVRSHAITGQRFVLPVIQRKLDISNLFESSVIEGKDVKPSSSDKLPTNYYVRWFLIEGKRFTPGTDFVVRDPQNGNKKVATIDGRAIDIGGRWDIKFYDDDLAKDPIFRSNLVLFACIVRYHPEAQKVMRRLYSELRKRIRPLTDDELRANLAIYLEKLEKEKNIKFDDKNEKIEFALKLIRTRGYSDEEIMRLLRLKYDMHITPHELSMLFNPRRVRS